MPTFQDDSIRTTFSQVENEPATSDVKRGLEQIRQRLLDLSARNKLLNFRHGATSLRFVGVDLEPCFNALIAEKKLALIPVPKPQKDVAANIWRKTCSQASCEGTRLARKL
jgi:hypothetical protein